MSDKTVESRVNALLAQKQREYLKILHDCQRPDLPERDADSEKMLVAYVSKNLLSLDVRVTLWTCAAYPQVNMAQPLTIDLRTSGQADLDRLFQQDFIDSVLPRLYFATYPPRWGDQDHAAEEECLNDLKNSDYGYLLWIDRRRGGLIVKPDVPHVLQGCAIEEVIGWAELATYVRDGEIEEEFRRLAERPPKREKPGPI